MKGAHRVHKSLRHSAAIFVRGMHKKCTEPETSAISSRGRRKPETPRNCRERSAQSPRPSASSTTGAQRARDAPQLPRADRTESAQSPSMPANFITGAQRARHAPRSAQEAHRAGNGPPQLHFLCTPLKKSAERLRLCSPVMKLPTLSGSVHTPLTTIAEHRLRLCAPPVHSTERVRVFAPP